MFQIVPSEGWHDLQTTQASGAATVRFVDTTMLYAPKSGGVKRYLTAKRAWLSRNRSLVRHSLVVPGRADAHDGHGLWSVHTTSLPLGDGYRLPASRGAWYQRLLRQSPHLIEAGDPYTPGLAALMAGQKLGCPVIGFCHTDLGALAALHIGGWAEKPVRKKWGQVYNRFDKVIAPSVYMAGRLADAGVNNVLALPLGVDVQVFRPRQGEREKLRAKLGVNPDTRLLVFAGRPAREKRLDILVEAVERLGDPYRLLLIGAGDGAPASDYTIRLPFESNPAALARLLSGCDAFVHANDVEPFGLVVLEAMACGLPIVGACSGGVAENIDDTVGQIASRSNVPGFAEAISALFQRDIATIGERARARAVDRHGWNSVFERLTAVYSDVSGQAAFGRRVDPAAEGAQSDHDAARCA